MMMMMMMMMMMVMMKEEELMMEWEEGEKGQVWKEEETWEERGGPRNRESCGG